jgi:hypothetical protein
MSLEKRAPPTPSSSTSSSSRKRPPPPAPRKPRAKKKNNKPEQEEEEEEEGEALEDDDDDDVYDDDDDDGDVVPEIPSKRTRSSVPTTATQPQLPTVPSTVVQPSGAQANGAVALATEQLARYLETQFLAPWRSEGRPIDIPRLQVRAIHFRISHNNKDIKSNCNLHTGNG